MALYQESGRYPGALPERAWEPRSRAPLTCVEALRGDVLLLEEREYDN